MPTVNTWRLYGPASVLLIVLAIGGSGCRFNITTPSPVVSISNSNTNTSTNTNDNDLFPPSTGTPGNGSPGGPGVPIAGPRVADPPAGLSLPLPTYGETALASFAAAHAALLAQSCQTQHGAAAWQFLDRFVDTLRAQDTRWGYVCNDGATCANPSPDKVAYHATAGPDVAGARGVWLVDVITDHCGAAPKAFWNVIGFDPAGVFGTRGRF